MREFETTFAKGLKKGLREDDENPRNEEALVECLNAKPSEDGLIPIVAITTPMDVSMAWPFPQVFDRPIADPVCDGITDVGYSGDDPIVLTVSSTTEVTITSGLPPFTWAITGTGLSWTYETTRGRTNVLIIGSGASGDGSWTATDRCGDEVGGDTAVCADDLSYDDDNPTTIAQSDSDVEITISDGIGPFAWVVTGTGFSLGSATTTGRSNTLNADGTGCGCATITITDACDDTATGYVRCTTGQWVLKGAYCGLAAEEDEATETPIGGNDLSYEYIKGCQKQTHTCDYQSTQNYQNCETMDDCSGYSTEELERTPCLDWYPAYGIHRVPCSDIPSGALPNRSQCWRNHSYAYYEWEC